MPAASPCRIEKLQTAKRLLAHSDERGRSSVCHTQARRSYRGFINFSRSCLVLLGALLPGLVQAQAQGWPNRQIRLIVPQGAGSGTDVIARLVATGVTERLGQSIVVENMPAALGILAHQTAGRAAPDGATLLFATVSGLAINPVTIKALPYDPTRDFAPVAMVVDFAPQMLSVNAELPVKSVAEFIDLRQGQREQAIVRSGRVRDRSRRFGASSQQTRRPRHDRDTLSFGCANGE